MKINLFKNLPVAIACLSSVAAFAGMDMDSRVSQLEAQMKQVRTATENNSFGAKCADGAPTLENSCEVYLGIGAIYQIAVLGNTEYAYSDNDSTAAYPLDGDLREAGSDWSWGINAMAGYRAKHDGFDIRVTNSYFDDNSSSSVTAGYGGTVVPLRALSTIVAAGFTTCSEASSKLKVGYDLLGLELGKEYFVSQYLSLRPKAGLLTSWMWLEHDISYSGGALGVDSVYTEDSSNAWGIGPQVGFDATYCFGKGFSFFADATGALMYGRIKAEHEESFSSSTSQNSRIDAYGHRIIPYVQALIGVSYGFYSDNNKNHFLIRAGYNTQFFFSANQMIRPSTQNNGSVTQEYFYRENNNLQTQGLLVDFAWDF